MSLSMMHNALATMAAFYKLKYASSPVSVGGNYMVWWSSKLQDKHE